MQYIIPAETNYYHFMTEVALGLHEGLIQQGTRDCTLWYDGPYTEIVQLFSSRPLQPVASAPPQMPTLPVRRLQNKEDFRRMISLRDFLSSQIAAHAQAPGITVVQREKTREYAEHAELVAKLERFGLPVRTVQFEKMPFATQVNAARSSRVLILPHGAAYVNMMFMPAASHIIELNPKAYVNWHVPAMAAAFGHSYTDLEASTPGIFGRLPTARVRDYLANRGWPTRRKVRAWLPDRLEMERVVRDVARFSIPPEKVTEQVERLLTQEARPL